jgi:hypothetical protein
MKQCRICLKLKDEKEFYNLKRARDGLRCECISCHSKQNHLNFLKNRKEVLLKQRDRRQQPGFKIKNNEYQRNYRKKETARMTHRIWASGKNRDLLWIPILDNPFPEDISIHYHHINDILVIPLPRITHLKLKAKLRGDDPRCHQEHRRICNNFIEKIYQLDLEKLLRGYLC